MLTPARLDLPRNEQVRHTPVRASSCAATLRPWALTCPVTPLLGGRVDEAPAPMSILGANSAIRFVVSFWVGAVEILGPGCAKPGGRS